MSEDETNDAVLLFGEDVRNVKAQAWKQASNLPFYLLKDMKSLHFCLKHLQEKGTCSIDRNFYYSSVHESCCVKFVNHPTIIYKMISGAETDSRPIPQPSRKHSLKEILTSTKLEPNSLISSECGESFLATVLNLLYQLVLQIQILLQKIIPIFIFQLKEGPLQSKMKIKPFLH